MPSLTTNKVTLGYYISSFVLLVSIIHINFRTFTSRAVTHEVPGADSDDLQTALTKLDSEDDYPTSLIPRSRHLRNAAFTMEESVHYSLNFTLEWESLIPSGTAGAVRLGPDKRYYIVSMFHQLQCLDELRRAVVQTGNGSDSSSERVHHCLNYIRQMLLCAANVRLEPVKPTAGGRGADGFWLEHRCRDWSMLRREVEDNYERWQVGNPEGRGLLN
ncbi:hypothetical protein L226DRAFT_570654 [Lentinus tigrinus ALCF2SS1-7]|uniref:uncharacterized protein n=1 Tax=Lentinus tigrinus ALCF2SS1-7 TaxID=1328758 RepID=UPI001165F82F|nr:hypothetical protein L226DRAFT_570654 [Lentinus tigrinus ALCF2SS1-7]